MIPGPLNISRSLVLLASAAFVLLYAALAVLRVGYPFELEWLEGAAVDHVRTILAGAPLYGPPSLDFTPLTYTPGYFYLAAALSAVTGDGFLPLRLISIVSSAGVLVLVYLLAAREAGSADAGIVAAGLFAAMYGWTDGWFDIARNDSLMLLLALSAIYVLRWFPSAAGAATAGLLLGACFLVKQTGAIFAVPLAVCCLVRGWRPFVAFTIVIGTILGGTTILLDRLFSGWYSYYVFAVPGQHPLAYEVLWKFWRFDLFRPLPVALAAAAGCLLWRLRRDRPAGLFLLLATAALFGGSLASRLHSLSYINVVLPAYAAVSILSGVALHEWATASRTARSGAIRLLPIAIYGVALLQLLRLSYWPAALVPSARDVATGELYLERLAAMPGEVFVPYHGYLPALAGKNTHAHAVVIADVIRGKAPEAGDRLARELDDALRTHRFQSVLILEAPTAVTAYLPVDEYYRIEGPVVEWPSRFWRAEIRYVPR